MARNRNSGRDRGRAWPRKKPSVKPRPWYAQSADIGGVEGIRLRPMWLLAVLTCGLIYWWSDYSTETILVATVIAVLLMWLVGRLSWARGMATRMLDPVEQDKIAKPHPGTLAAFGWAWVVGGALFLLTVLGLLEFRQPYYFTQDDNLSQFLPVILQGCESLFHGVFPTWNPYQFLGSPTSSLGIYALTYPPTYVSYAIAKYLLGDPYATLEVFAFVHLMAAYFAVCLLAGRLGCRPSLRMLSAVSYCLSGYFLIAGRSWYYMLPTATWMPLLVASILWFLSHRATWSWVLSTGLVIGLFFHAGNAQMWVYGMCCYAFLVLVLVLVRALSIRDLVPIAAATALGIGIAAPLLLVQYKETASIARESFGYGIMPDIGALFLPWPLAHASDPWGTLDIERFGHIFYFGTVFGLPTVIALGLAVMYRWPKRIWRGNVWLAMVVFTLLWALGDMGLLWFLTKTLPPFNKFFYTFKWVPFLVLFLIMSSALIIERLLRASSRQRMFEMAIAALTACLLIYHAAMATPCLYSYGFKPYPPRPDWVAKIEQSSSAGRWFSISPLRSVLPTFYESLALDFPTVYSLIATYGYDLLMEGMPENREMYRSLLAARDLEEWLVGQKAYGVRWVVVYRTMWSESLGPNPKWTYLEKPEGIKASLADALRATRQPLIQSGDVWVYEMEDAKPLAYVEEEDEDDKPLDITFDGAGAWVDTAAAPSGFLIVNFLQRPLLRVYSDGKLLPMFRDPWDRVRVDLPAGVRRVRMAYQPPWTMGLAVGGVLALGALGLMGLHQMLASRARASGPHSGHSPPRQP